MVDDMVGWPGRCNALGSALHLSRWAAYRVSGERRLVDGIRRRWGRKGTNYEPGAGGLTMPLCHYATVPGGTLR
jgi:hypothetical protein